MKMQLDRELDDLRTILLNMCNQVISNINTAVKSFKESENSGYINDELVNSYERLIQEICLTILVKERAYASDLKLVSGILKLSSDLERIGDIAEDLQEYSLKLENINTPLCSDAYLLLEKSLLMVTDAIDSYIKKDLTLASDVIKRDDEIDSTYADLIDNQIPKKAEGRDIHYAIYTTIVVKYIERIADHAVNIAEWVIYMINGYYKDTQLF